MFDAPDDVWLTGQRRLRIMSVWFEAQAIAGALLVEQCRHATSRF
jgi:hypothetical protein